MSSLNSNVKGTKFLIEAAMIAGVYAALTMILMPLSYGVMQIRVSEALTILPFFTPAAIPGLFVGCLIANIPMGMMDVICGSGTTLVAAICSYKLRGKPLLVPLPPVILNGVVVGAMLHYAYSVPIPLLGCMAWVALGQFAACYLIGYPLLRYLKKYEKIFK